MRRGPKQRLELWRKQIAELRRAARPLIGDLFPVVTEIGEVRARSVRPASAARSRAWPPSRSAAP